ncbi:MAG: hypothetical protein APF81_17505 [Desulfosporosinus sp. BRH_c37]|nr:MAG: hypothetical protein APF81_17505 [Desulfosporosinus sp. BRH_c37]
MASVESKTLQKQFAIAFIEKIAPSNLSFRQRLILVLEARGFLLEQRDGKIFLSDNSYLKVAGDLADNDFLDQLLRQTGIGQVNERNITISGECSTEALVDFFLKHDGCEGFGYSFDDWANFQRRQHGQKIPLYLLDPFVSRLVKTISAIGINTHYSCDGHGENKIQLGMSSKYYRAWFETVMRALWANDTSPTCQWKFVKERLLEISNPESDVLALYEEIQRVAQLLYNNRITLRRSKSLCLAGLSEGEVINLSCRQLVKVFWDRSGDILLDLGLGNPLKASA